MRERFYLADIHPLRIHVITTTAQGGCRGNEAGNTAHIARLIPRHLQRRLAPQTIDIGPTRTRTSG